MADLEDRVQELEERVAELEKRTPVNPDEFAEKVKETFNRCFEAESNAVNS